MRRFLETDRRHSPPREGPALLQGLILCGRCGRRMTAFVITLRKSRFGARLRVPNGKGIEHAEPLCPTHSGALGIDRLVVTLLVEAISPNDSGCGTDGSTGASIPGLEEADRLRQKTKVERAPVMKADLGSGADI